MRITLHKYADGTYGGAVDGYAYWAAPTHPDSRDWEWRVWRGKENWPVACGRAGTMRECRRRIMETTDARDPFR